MPFDPTRPVQTRDGRPARILALDVDIPGYPIAAVIGYPGKEEVAGFTAEGRFLEGLSALPSDLINVPERVTTSLWVKNKVARWFPPHTTDSAWTRLELTCEGDDVVDVKICK